MSLNQRWNEFQNASLFTFDVLLTIALTEKKYFHSIWDKMRQDISLEMGIFRSRNVDSKLKLSIEIIIGLDRKNVYWEFSQKKDLFYIQGNLNVVLRGEDMKIFVKNQVSIPFLPNFFKLKISRFSYLVQSAHGEKCKLEKNFYFFTSVANCDKADMRKDVALIYRFCGELLKWAFLPFLYQKCVFMFVIRFSPRFCSWCHKQH